MTLESFHRCVALKSLNEWDRKWLPKWLAGYAKFHGFHGADAPIVSRSTPASSILVAKVCRIVWGVAGLLICALASPSLQAYCAVALDRGVSGVAPGKRELRGRSRFQYSRSSSSSLGEAGTSLSLLAFPHTFLHSTNCLAAHD
jgi:hypothetical protein